MIKIAWTEDYCHKLPDNHRFPMIKYELLPQQLLYEGIVTKENFFSPASMDEEDILAVHTETYWRKLKNLDLSRSEERRTGFPLSKQLVYREQVIARGTIDCSEFAIMHGVSLNIAGGTHHAFTDRGEGFCLLNDIAIAARYMLRNKFVSRVLVVDLDVHQGNGTAEIFSNDPDVFTFSMHGAKNYPHHKQRSDLDVPLPDKTGDEEYLRMLDRHLEPLFDSVQPDIVYFQSGVDVLSTDALGRLSLTRHGCRERDRRVLSVCYQKGVPVVVVMGGGYSPHIRDIVDAHANTFRVARELFD